MSVYLSNYWSLYSEFINVLKDLKYKDIPIALMTNFYQQINDELSSEMEHKDFEMKLNDSGIKAQNEIQPFFERMVAPFKRPFKTNVEGKILINQDYTRISEKTLSDHFSGDQTMILSRSRTSEIFGIPNVCIGGFKSDTRHASEELIRIAASILAKYEGHPAFSNPFFSQTFIKRIPGIVDAIETVSNLYDQIPISAVLIGTTEDVVSRSLAVVGAVKGIPSICLQHGILMGEEAFIPVFSSHVGIYGEYEKSWYLARGLEEKRIAVIGHPRYDEIFTSARLPNLTFIEEHGLDPNKITLLLATGPRLDADKIQMLITGLAANEKFQLIIKPHPWELSKRLISIYTDLEEKYKSVRVIKDKKADTRELIFNSDGVIASLSTVALESFLFNKPVFVFHFIHANREYDYYNSLESYIQNEPAELIKTVSHYFASEQEKLNYENVKNKFLLSSYKIEHSGGELSNLINRLINERPE
ncbi:CDP-glycerol glycerophosphotransferase family protein [Paenibacillus sp. S150]|uniref:CDP-glycerol glycerophosphotransferase family protein n=1 Tax=Paenibacillus sp. S150 TaxID=2749826 RepID=UPI001C57C250|nr:CDP-glycerol glycerophosphotransferase family protein [Paenibacillus sp. S150]MBW4080588.1 CDP-glycerol glycerophosphotransferase family protein [Paenibacillus sp. S150]